MRGRGAAVSRKESTGVTASTRAYIFIRDAITAGTFPAGHPLREEEVAETAGVSRTPVREALRRLDAEGLVELLPNRGARVAGWTEHDLDEIFDLRVILESYGARLAASNITADQLNYLRTLCNQMDAEVASDRHIRFQHLTELNNRFHRGVLEASGNRRLVAISASVVQRSLVTLTFHLYSPDQLERSCSGHRELVEALLERDQDWAEATMRTHLLAGRRTMGGHR